MDGTEADVLAYMGVSSPASDQATQHQSLERRNREIKRCSDIVGIFSNEAAFILDDRRLLLEQNDKWIVQRVCYMSIAPLSGDLNVSMPALAA